MDHITKITLNIEDIRFDKSRLVADIHDPELGIRSQYFKELVDTLNSYGPVIPPIFVDCYNTIIDGHHRYLAHRLVEKPTIDVYRYWKPFVKLPLEDLIRFGKVKGKFLAEATEGNLDKDQILRELIHESLGDDYEDDEVYYIGVFPTGHKREKGEKRGLRIFFEDLKERTKQLDYPYSGTDEFGTYEDDILSDLLKE